jgi:phage gp36-like protein
MFARAACLINRLVAHLSIDRIRTRYACAFLLKRKLASGTLKFCVQTTGLYAASRMISTIVPIINPD